MLKTHTIKTYCNTKIIFIFILPQLLLLLTNFLEYIIHILKLQNKLWLINLMYKHFYINKFNILIKHFEKKVLCHIEFAIY